MNVLEIKNIVRKDMPISYRRIYSGDLMLGTEDHASTQTSVEFVLEHVATGAVEIQVTIGDDRVPPATHDAVTEYIENLEKNGQLP